MKNTNMSKRTYQIMTNRSKSVFGKTLSQLNAAEMYYLKNYKIINQKYAGEGMDSSKPNATYGNWFVNRVENTRYTKKKGVMQWRTALDKVVYSNFLTPEKIRSKLNLMASLK